MFWIKNNNKNNNNNNKNTALVSISFKNIKISYRPQTYYIILHYIILYLIKLHYIILLLETCYNVLVNVY